MHLIFSNDAVRMEYFRRYPASKLTSLWAGWMVMIRSSGGLWRSDGKGYTKRKTEAGLYTLRDACSRTFHCGPEKHVVFLSAQGTSGDRILPTQEHEDWQVERLKWEALSASTHPHHTDKEQAE